MELDRPYPSGLNLRAGSSQSISASISGVPTPKVSWFKDGKPLSGTFVEIETSEFGTQITLRGVDMDASGSYRVVVENEAGSSSAEVAVTVKGLFYSLFIWC